MSHENIPERDVKPGGTRVRQGRQWGEAGLRGGTGEGTRLGQHVYVMAVILRVADGRGACAAGASKEGAGERAYNVQCKRSARQRGRTAEVRLSPVGNVRSLLIFVTIDAGGMKPAGKQPPRCTCRAVRQRKGVRKVVKADAACIATTWRKRGRGNRRPPSRGRAPRAPLTVPCKRRRAVCPGVSA